MKKPKRALLSSRFKATAVATSLSAVLALFATAADAASMGRLSVWSGLGQPLRAEVEVSATPEEQGTLIARVATQDMYRQAGLEYSPAISSLRVLVDRRGARPVIRISSEAPMREAFLDILLELSWSNGRLAREYTVLLDPVDAPGGGRGAGGGAFAPPVALPETRMSYNLSQRGAPEGKPSLPPPGVGGQMPPLAEPSSRGIPAAKPLPSLRPNYAAAPSEARLVPPAPPTPAAPASALDPRATAKPRPGTETPAAPPAPVAAPAPVAVAAAPAPAPEPRRELKSEPRLEQKPAPIAAPRELRATEAPPARLVPPTPEPRPATPEKPLPSPKTLAQLEEDLRAAELSQQQERGIGKKSTKATKIPAEEKLQVDKKGKGKGQGKGKDKGEATTTYPASETAKDGGAPNTYTVQRGDTLMKIARETKPEEVSLDQMLVALFRNNEAAFEGNMNRMKTGRILNLPDPEKVAEVPRSKAHREVIAQSTDFAAYRNKLAEIAKSGLGKDDAVQQVAAGKISPRVEETKPAPSARDQLKLTRTLSGKGGKTASAEGGRKAAFEEDAIARERALKEANLRVTELEQNIKNLQSLIELKNRSMSELQRQAKGGPAVSPQADAAKAEKSAAAAPAAGAGLPVNGGKTAASGAGVGSAQTGTKAEATSQSMPSPDKAADGVATDSESSRGKDVVADQKSADKPKAENGLSTLKHPAVWGSAAGLGALLLGWLGFSLLRTQSKITTLRPMKEATAEPTDSLAERLRSARESIQSSRKEDASSPARLVKVASLQIDDPVVTGTVLPDAAMEAAVVVDTPQAGVTHKGVMAASRQDEAMVKPADAPASLIAAETFVTEPQVGTKVGALTSSVEPGPVALSRNEVEPVVSAIKETVPTVLAAAATPPAPAQEVAATGRTSIHLELLRLYAQRKELEQFDALAHELHRLSGGEGADWAEAGALGRSIDPANPLYAANVPAVAAPAPSAPLSSASAPALEQISQAESDGTIGASVAPVPMPDALRGVDFDFGDFSASVPVESRAPATAPQPVPVAAVAVQTPAPPPAPPPAQALVAKPLDLSGIDLDLPRQNEPAGTQAAPAGPDQKLDDAGAKLELARAYREMGDVEGARELLTEVVQEGSAAQQTAAREVLGKLG